MPIRTTTRLAQWGLLGSLLFLVAGAIAAIAAHPAVVTAEPGAAAFYLTLFGLAVVVYGALSLVGTRAAAANGSLRIGLGLGLACAAAWTVELIAANLILAPAAPQGRWLYSALYFGSSAVAVFLPGLAGLLAARQAGRVGAGTFKAGVQAGLLCGLCGGLGIFLASFVLSGLLISAGHLDPQTVREFQHSGLPDLNTYIVSDYLAGMIAHLWIGLITGLLLGALGSVVGTTVSKKTP